MFVVCLYYDPLGLRNPGTAKAMDETERQRSHTEKHVAGGLRHRANELEAQTAEIAFDAGTLIVKGDRAVCRGDIHELHIVRTKFEAFRRTHRIVGGLRLR